MSGRTPAKHTRTRTSRKPTAAQVLRVVLAAALGTGAALLIACGSSGKGLIPSANAGPLQEDIEAVENAAKSGNGNCGETESALLKLSQDYGDLPTTLNKGLSSTLRQGVANLRIKALALCAEPLPGSTNTTTTDTTTTTTKTETAPPVKTETTNTETTEPPPSEEETPGEGGGTPAPGEGGGTGGEEEQGSPGGQEAGK